MIKLNNKSKKLILLQRNELLSNKQKWLRKKFGRYAFTNFFVNCLQSKNLEKQVEELFQKEFDTFKNFLPKDINNIMDIGCGLGVVNIFLNKLYNNKTNFFLLDKDKVDKKIAYGFKSNYESYNDLSETSKILLKNQINEDKIFLYDVEQEIKIYAKIDLVISLKSMGYHYPIETYVKLFKQCCNKNTIFIFDIISSHYNRDFLYKFFQNIEIIHEEMSIHPLKRLYCYGFKND